MDANCAKRGPKKFHEKDLMKALKKEERFQAQSLEAFFYFFLKTLKYLRIIPIIYQIRKM